jgi:hypothetical protein
MRVQRPAFSCAIATGVAAGFTLVPDACIGSADADIPGILLISMPLISCPLIWDISYCAQTDVEAIKIDKKIRTSLLLKFP